MLIYISSGYKTQYIRHFKQIHKVEGLINSRKYRITTKKTNIELPMIFIVDACTGSIHTSMEYERVLPSFANENFSTGWVMIGFYWATDDTRIYHLILHETAIRLLFTESCPLSALSLDYLFLKGSSKRTSRHQARGGDECTKKRQVVSSYEWVSIFWISVVFLWLERRLFTCNQQRFNVVQAMSICHGVYCSKFPSWYFYRSVIRIFMYQRCRVFVNHYRNILGTVYCMNISLNNCNAQWKTCNKWRHYPCFVTFSIIK